MLHLNLERSFNPQDFKIPRKHSDLATTEYDFHTSDFDVAEVADFPEFVDGPFIVDHETFLNTTYGDIELSGMQNTGDLVDRDHETTIEVMNNNARIYAAAKLAEYEANGENSKFHRDVTFLKQQTVDFETFVSNENTKRHAEFEWVKTQYALADEQALRDISAEQLEGEAAMIRRAAYRVLSVQPEDEDTETPLIEMVSDFDLTMSKGEDKLRMYSPSGKEDARVYLEPNIPSSVPAEKHIEQSRDGFIEAFALYWNDYLEAAPHLFEAGGRDGRVPLRDGVRDFFTWAKDNNWDVNIVSANFGRFAHQALAGIPDVDRAGFLAIWHNDVRSTMKDEILKYFAIRNPHSADIFIGDGGSDTPATNAHETTAAYFALEGYGFSKQLAQMDVCQFTYKDFNDIMKTMDKIKAECAMLKGK